MKELAPIALFTYKRLDTLKITITALQENFLASISDLYIFSDNSKGLQDANAVQEVRNFIKTIEGFKSITIHEADKNKGLATSIIEGVSLVLKRHDTIIVLEDDLKSTNNFLDFMNQSLDYFKNEEEVFSISGFSFNLDLENNFDNNIYFLNRGWSWGWATWRDRWDKVDWEIKDYDLFLKDKKAQRKFSKGGSDLNGMLKKQMTCELDSWAIRWFYNQFKLQGLTVYPVKSKIQNEGFGIEATHTKGSSRRYQPNMDTLEKRNFNFDNDENLSIRAQSKFQNKMGIVSRLKSKVETFLKI